MSPPSSPRLRFLGLALVAGLVLTVALVRGLRARDPLPVAPTITTSEIAAELARRPDFEPLGRDAPASSPAGGGREPVLPEPVATAPAAAPPDPGAEEVTFGARLLDFENRPLLGAELAWYGPGLLGLPEARTSARADGSGAVWLALPRAELPAGRLLLVAGGPGCMRQLQWVDARRYAGTALVSLGEIVLRAGGSVAGRVLDARGQPVAGAFAGLTPEWPDPTDEVREQLRLWPRLDDLGAGNAPPIAFTDEDGHFTIEGAPTGRFQVVAARVPRGEVTSLPDRESGVIVRPGEETRVRDLVLGDSRPEERILGLVRSPQGSPVEGAELGLGDEAGQLAFRAGLQTGADGRFALLAPASGTYRLRLRDPAGRWKALEVPDVRPGGAPLELRFSDPLQDTFAVAADPATESVPPAPVESRPEARLRGRLTLGGRSPGSWIVEVGGRHTILDHAGEFALRELEVGPCTVSAHPASGSARRTGLTAPIELAAGYNEWALDLPAGELVLENLPRAEPAPTPGEGGADWPEYILTCEGSGFSWMLLFQETADGRVTLPDLPAGHHVLRFRGPGTTPEGVMSWPVAQEFELVAGRTTRIVLP